MSTVEHRLLVALDSSYLSPRPTANIFIDPTGGLSPLSDRTEVEISIVDVNDNAPRFSNGPVYSGTVHENAPAGTSVTQVSAYDDDAGENGKVRYRSVKNQRTSGESFCSYKTMVCRGVEHHTMHALLGRQNART